MSSRKRVYVPIDGWGIISVPSNPDMPYSIGTFGCGPCIGIVLKHPDYIACAHVSNPSAAIKIREMLYTMQRLTSNNYYFKTTSLYLIGGEHNKKTKDIVLEILHEEQFSCLNIVMAKDSACCFPHVSNILADFETLAVHEYLLSGQEKFDDIDAFSILFKNMHPDAPLTCAYSPEYPSNKYIVSDNSDSKVGPVHSSDFLEAKHSPSIGIWKINASSIPCSHKAINYSLSGDQLEVGEDSILRYKPINHSSGKLISLASLMKLVSSDDQLGLIAPLNLGWEFMQRLFSIE